MRVLYHGHNFVSGAESRSSCRAQELDGEQESHVELPKTADEEVVFLAGVIVNRMHVKTTTEDGIETFDTQGDRVQKKVSLEGVKCKTHTLKLKERAECAEKLGVMRSKGF